MVKSDIVLPTSLGPSNDRLRLVSWAPANAMSSGVSFVLSIPKAVYNVCKSLGKFSNESPAVALALSTNSCSYFSPAFPPPLRKVIYIIEF